MLVKIGKYRGFCTYRGSYSLWSPGMVRVRWEGFGGGLRTPSQPWSVTPPFPSYRLYSMDTPYRLHSMIASCRYIFPLHPSFYPTVISCCLHSTAASYRYIPLPMQPLHPTVIILWVHHTVNILPFTSYGYVRPLHPTVTNLLNPIDLPPFSPLSFTFYG